MNHFITAILIGASVTIMAACTPSLNDTPATSTHVTQASLKGNWQAIRIEGKNLSGNTQHLPELNFDADNQRISGTDGCNRVMGHFKTNDDQIKLSPLASTKMMCVENMQDSDAFHLAMAKVEHFRITQENHLQLLDANGAVMVEFVPQQHHDNSPQTS
ncbi:MAG: META domain-containing protein [Acinetobacter sp.]